MHFSVAMISASVNPCTVNVLSISFQHALCPRPTFHAPVTLLYFYVDPSIKECFSVTMLAASVKPCTVNVLSISFQHVLWPSALHVHFALQWLCRNFTSTLALKCASLYLWYLLVSNFGQWIFLAYPFRTHIVPVPWTYISCCSDFVVILHWP